ncbi:3-phosphoshikimate 1-carboxyvinyltransferase [Ruminococcaceae bacterium OttesenSCG-928-L11]|nr:3-phosphoshikimate 1-carboxyvinyltransferase [Ruminococcaceae bacterium OttesenSCG-928-L11]
MKEIRPNPRPIVTPPPSKSLTHRALICGALAEGEQSQIITPGLSRDTAATLGALRAMGATVTEAESAVTIRGGLHCPAAPIDCDESGSTLRFLIPVAAMLGGEIAFTGRGRLLQRPHQVYEAVFARAGARYRRQDNCIVVGGPLRGGRYAVPGDISSQFISGLLLALPLAEEGSALTLETPLESRGYVDMTIDVMHRFGVDIHRETDGFVIPGGQRYRGTSYTVESDFSQAAFFLGAAALGRDVQCRGLNPNSLQGDRAILPVLEAMGATVTWRDGLLSVQADGLRAVTVDVRDIPDLVPPIAALLCVSKGTGRIVNAGRLRHKESDRLAALATELSRLGADITEEPEALCIRGQETLRGGQADAHGDHRIAMALGLAAIRCEEPVLLTGSECVDKSYPAFWADFEGGDGDE